MDNIQIFKKMCQNCSSENFTKNSTIIINTTLNDDWMVLLVLYIFLLVWTFLYE